MVETNWQCKQKKGDMQDISEGPSSLKPYIPREILRNTNKEIKSLTDKVLYKCVRQSMKCNDDGA